jgi:hypothetical protein
VPLYRRFAIGFLRLVLALLALWLVHVSMDRYSVFHLRYIRTFGHADMSLWLLWVSTAAAAGFVFGAAAWFPFGPVRYRWNRLLLAVLAFLPLAHFWFVLGYLIRHEVVSGWMGRDWFWDFGSQTTLAVLGGVAVASGFDAKRRTRSSSN